MRAYFVVVFILLYGCSEPKFVLRDRAPLGRTAIVIYPFIVIDTTIADSSTYRHEMAHWQQIQMVGPIHFYLSYFLEWLWLGMTHPKRDNYPYISYEIQAESYE